MTDRAVGSVWIDFTGRTRLSIVKATTNPCAIINALQAKSNAAILWNWDGTIDPQIGAAVSAEFQGVGQNVILQFTTASGTILKPILPAPAVSILMADGQTVDPAQIAAIIAACVGNLSDGAGNVATAYLGGFLAPARGDITPIG